MTVSAAALAAERADPLMLIRLTLDAARIGLETGYGASPATTLDLTNEAAARNDARPLPSSISTQRSATSRETGSRVAQGGGEEPAERDQWQLDLLPQTELTGGLLASASVLWWATRAGGLLAAMVASVPAWRSFDPLPVLARGATRRASGFASPPDDAKEAAELEAIDQSKALSRSMLGLDTAGTRTMLEEMVDER